MKTDPLPRLTILSQGERRVITCDEGLSVRDALDTTDLKVRSGCNGSGACGLCRVRIEAGAAGEPRGNELIMLTADELRDNIRLACQVMPAGDITIRVVNPAPKSGWRRITVDNPRSIGQARTRDGGAPGDDEESYGIAVEQPLGLASPPPRQSLGASPSKVAPLPHRPSHDEESYGIAVDLGTTNISMSLWDLRKEGRLSAVCGPNPQSRFGSDVMTRLISACGSEEKANQMSRMAGESIEAGILDMCGKDGYDFRKIRRVLIVGNTAMLTLLARKNADLLLRPDYWTAPIDCRPEGGHKWFENGRMGSDVSFEIVQPFGGFVGSDLLAGIVATGLTEGDAPSALIDFGTNSEIALWDGRKLWVTSAAGGPAFEGWGIRCGMPAEIGAIYRVTDAGVGEPPLIHVVGGDDARGICGSGIVDLIANLVQAGTLSRLGKLRQDLLGTGSIDQGYFVARGASDISLDNRDIDVFQRAKAAIGAGIKALSRLSGADIDELRRICVCGSFGRFLNIRNAMAIGLLPAAASERVEIWGSAALAGCESLLLLSPEKDDYLESLKGARTTLVNLSQVPEFDEYFLESLYLQPLQAGLKP
ncbi:MAG: ASKHA domain-containing protein [Syntrophorhabdales bacterium]